MAKVVYNGCYGGFGISLECARRMAELGNEEARRKVEDYDRRQKEKTGWEAAWWSSLDKTPRHDHALVQAVEELQDKANDDCAKLMVEELPDGTLYRIDEYDGMESVATQDTYEWTVAS